MPPPETHAYPNTTHIPSLDTPMSAEDDTLLRELTASAPRQHTPVDPHLIPLPPSPSPDGALLSWTSPAQHVTEPYKRPPLRTAAQHGDDELLQGLLASSTFEARTVLAGDDDALPATPHTVLEMDSSGPARRSHRSPFSQLQAARDDGFDADFDTDDDHHTKRSASRISITTSGSVPSNGFRRRNQRREADLSIFDRWSSTLLSTAQAVTSSACITTLIDVARDSQIVRSTSLMYHNVAENLPASEGWASALHRAFRTTFTTGSRSRRARTAEFGIQSVITFLLLLFCAGVWIQVLIRSGSLVRVWATRLPIRPIEQILARDGLAVQDQVDRLQVDLAHKHPKTFHVARGDGPAAKTANSPADSALASSILANDTNFHGQSGGGHNHPDKIAFEHFFSYPKPLEGGVFVEVGAYDGVSSSNTLFFEKVLHWRGLLIEGSTPNFLLLNHKRSEHAMRVHSAICAEKGEATFVGSGGTAGDVRFLTKQHIEKWSHFWNSEWVAPYNVPCFPLTDLLKTAGLEMIDFMSIDIEGGELEAIKTMEWTQFIVRALVIEGSADKDIEAHLLKEANMCLAFSVSQNDFYVSKTDPELKKHCKE